MKEEITSNRAGADHVKLAPDITRGLSSKARSVCYAAIIVIGMIGFLVAMYAPQDVLERSGVAAWYFSLASIVFPAVDANRTNPAFRQIASLYYAITWLAFPFFFLLWWNHLRTRKSGILVKPRSTLTLGNYLVLFAAIPFFFFFCWVATFLWHGGDTRHVAFGNSLTVLACFGLIRPWAVAAFLALGLAPLKKIVFGRI